MLGFHPIATSLVKLVPAYHFYQQLLQRVDFSFVRPLVAPFYSAIGRPSLDPVVFVKLLLVQHLENITSDRKLVELASLHVGIRAFLGYELAHPLPSHSTLSRTRQRLPESVFEACFTHIVGLCVAQGLVSGHTQVVDSAYIKANASMSRLRPKLSRWSAQATTRVDPPQTPPITASADRLQHIQRFHAAIRKAGPDKPGQLVSNLTHYSPADLDARVAFKTGKARQLAYLASVSVDAAQHVITHIHADLADWRDSRYLLAIVDTTQQRLQTFGVTMSAVVADAGYSSGENYAQLEARGLTGYIAAHGKYKAERAGFTYDATRDSYTCSQGKELTFDQLVVDRQGNPKKRYMAKATDCKHCPLAVQCKGKTAREKRLYHTAYKGQYDRMLRRLATRVGKRMMRLRMATVEPVLGSLITYFGLRHISKKRQAGAAKVMYVAAMAYNLKKYLRATPCQQADQVVALPVPNPFRWLLLYFCNSHRCYGTRRLRVELRRKGYRVGRQRLRTAMRRRGLHALQPKAFTPRTTDSTHGLRCAPNRLLDQPKPTQANRVWVSDITYLPLANGDWAYLCAFQDMASKQVVGWHVMATMPEELINTALQRAFWAQPPTPGLLVHSDRGGQYCGNAYRKLLHDHHALRSQSRRSDCYDNAQAESLWSRLKTEVLEVRERPVFADLADAQRSVADYFDYYNHQRLHSSIDYQTPYLAHQQLLPLNALNCPA